MCHRCRSVSHGRVSESRREAVTIAMMTSILVLLLVLLTAIAGLCGYALYRGHRRPDNCPSRFLNNRASLGENAKVVVCIGDSITHGTASCNYVDILAERLGKTGFHFVNAGINSELAYNVLQRLDEVIGCNPDFITILIGTNDSNKSLTDAAARKAIRQMHLPQRPSAEWYRSNLFEICRALEAGTRARIALLSLPVITEDTSHPAFEHSLRFIEIIREVTEEEELVYLPLRERMEAFLLEHPSSTRLSFEHRQRLNKLAFARHLFLKKSWNEIAAAYGFHLLTDFVHLSCSGAEMAADLIEGFLTNEADVS